MNLTADLIEAFAGTFISPRYDNCAPTPQLHRDAWALYASDVPQALCIAPREHAKSTALTTVYILAEVLFRKSDYVVLISSTEESAVEQLGNIAEELHENDDLRREFGVKGFPSDSKQDLIVEMQDGHRFRILCRGAEQRIRGRLWKGKRPNLLVVDDAEDDEQVENADRRTKFRRWFFRAAKQAVGRYGRTRVHGTILHEDSLLSRLRKNREWKHLYFKAHRGFDDFSDILWPEQWPEERLRARQREFVEEGDAGGYSQEFLNDPQDNAEAYLRRQDFIPMTEEDHEREKVISTGWDFAVSKADLANRTSVTVGGVDILNRVCFLDFQAGRWNPSVTPSERESGESGWIDLMFEVEARWHPQAHFIEGGVIWNSVKQMIYTEMETRGVFLNLVVLNPVKDKAVRGLSLKKRHRAGMTRWNTEADGYVSAKEEMLRFTGHAAARLDDQFDSAATLCLGIERAPKVDQEDFYDEEDFEMERGFWNRKTGTAAGRSNVTGY
jgi:hypothetical protein